ncbi:MAG: toll/interleukin-1 receptor domain-containing protein [Candidatus Aminicenantes bacterium]|nr:MAG: toll/interleukin-1 receptor domain-containing protein [Candidatus Aminicenantes bacterium]
MIENRNKNGSVPKIFISHASEDKPIIEKFEDTILYLGLNIQMEEIFCSSTAGTKPPIGVNFKDIIKSNLKNAEVVILVITPNFKNSEMCQNEAGAAWILSKKVIPLIVEPIDYSSVGVIHEKNQIEKLTDREGLDRLKDELEKTLKIPSKIPLDKWNRLKEDFLDYLLKYLEKNPFTSIKNIESQNRSLKKRCRLLLAGYIIVLLLLLILFLVRPILNNRYNDKPEGKPQSFISLGTEKEVGTSGEIEINETFAYSPEDSAMYWIYFIDYDDYIWPQAEVSSGQVKGVYSIPGGFKGGKLVLAMVSEDTIKDYFTGGKVKKTPEFKIREIIFETKIKIKNGGKYEKK